MTKRKRIKMLEERLTLLENMHALSYTHKSAPVPEFQTGPLWTDINKRNIYFYRARQLTENDYLKGKRYHPAPFAIDYDTIYNIPKLAVDTKEIEGVSFEELARLVIDNTPISRDQVLPIHCYQTFGKSWKKEEMHTKFGTIGEVKINEETSK